MAAADDLKNAIAAQTQATADYLAAKRAVADTHTAMLAAGAANIAVMQEAGLSSDDTNAFSDPYAAAANAEIIAAPCLQSESHHEKEPVNDHVRS